MEIGKSYCMAVSVDVDRFTDAYLRKRVCPGLRNADGRTPTPGEVRVACYDARNRGLRVFPPCDNTKPDGSCAGHERGTS